ncbi:MAG: hypothetical protein IJX64_04255 [Clostridia bacterium]|nr:hypothetical protein [Clostridia bacterium]
MTVTIKADGSRLTAEQPVLADGTAGAVRVRFALDDIWAGLAVTAVFRTPRGDILMPLTDGACALPAEATEKCGNVLVGVFGTDGVRTLTSTFCRLRISQGVPTEGETAKNYTPGLYEQFAAKFARFENMTVTVDKGEEAAVAVEEADGALRLHFTLPSDDSYVLTQADKQEIAAAVLNELPASGGVQASVEDETLIFSNASASTDGETLIME